MMKSWEEDAGGPVRAAAPEACIIHEERTDE